MTVRNLFNIILKIIGIFFLKDIFELVYQSFISLSYFILIENPSELHSMVINIALTSIIVLFYIITARLLILKSEMLIDWMKLDKDFEEKELNINIHRTVILSIAIIVIGGLMIAGGIPPFISRWYEYSQIESMGAGIRQSKSVMILEGAKITIGILLINFHKPLVNLIEVRRKK